MPFENVNHMGYGASICQGIKAVQEREKLTISGTQSDTISIRPCGNAPPLHIPASLTLS